MDDRWALHAGECAFTRITGVPALSGDAGRRWDRTGRVSVPYEDKGGIIGMSIFEACEIHVSGVRVAGPPRTRPPTACRQPRAPSRIGPGRHLS